MSGQGKYYFWLCLWCCFGAGGRRSIWIYRLNQEDPPSPTWVGIIQSVRAQLNSQSTLEGCIFSVIELEQPSSALGNWNSSFLGLYSLGLYQCSPTPLSSQAWTSECKLHHQLSWPLDLNWTIYATSFPVSWMFSDSCSWDFTALVIKLNNSHKKSL